MRFRLLRGLPSRSAERRPERRARGRGERGAVAVEAALLIPFLAILVFGTIEAALLMRSAIAVTSMSREGARVASSEPRTTGFTKDAADAIARSAATLDFSKVEVWVYAPGADGKPPASCGTTTCVKYSGWVNPTGPTAGYFSTVSGSWNPDTINACLLTSGTDQRDFVGVYVSAKHDWLTKFFPGTGMAVGARSVMKFEPILVPPALLCKGTSTP